MIKAARSVLHLGLCNVKVLVLNKFHAKSFCLVEQALAFGRKELSIKLTCCKSSI